MQVKLRRSTIRCCALVSLVLAIAAASATAVTEGAPPAALGAKAIETAKQSDVAKRSNAAPSASAPAPAASTASASESGPARIPDALLGFGAVAPASTQDQISRLDEKSAPWAPIDPRTAPAADGSVWVNGEPEVTWLRSVLNYLRDDGLTTVIVVLTLVGLVWLLYAIWSYLSLSLTRADEVRPRRKRHRHRQSHGSERSEGESSTREHRRRRHSRPSP